MFTFMASFISQRLLQAGHHFRVKSVVYHTVYVDLSNGLTFLLALEHCMNGLLQAGLKVTWIVVEVDRENTSRLSKLFTQEDDDL